jgi:PAS domain S-box-containing protein
MTDSGSKSFRHRAPRVIGVDVPRHSNTEAERNRLATGIEQVAESVIITDADARITYVNPAFERVSGYARDEVIGQNPRLLQSGLQPASFYEAMWAAITNGVPWRADFVNRRKDGTLFTDEAVISPIRDSAARSRATWPSSATSRTSGR